VVAESPAKGPIEGSNPTTILSCIHLLRVSVESQGGRPYPRSLMILKRKLKLRKCLQDTAVEMREKINAFFQTKDDTAHQEKPPAILRRERFGDSRP